MQSIAVLARERGIDRMRQMRPTEFSRRHRDTGLSTHANRLGCFIAESGATNESRRGDGQTPCLALI
jgi:hypothetical protein